MRALRASESPGVRRSGAGPRSGELGRVAMHSASLLCRELECTVPKLPPTDVFLGACTLGSVHQTERKGLLGRGGVGVRSPQPSTAAHGQRRGGWPRESQPGEGVLAVQAAWPGLGSGLPARAHLHVWPRSWRQCGPPCWFLRRDAVAVSCFKTYPLADSGQRCLRLPGPLNSRRPSSASTSRAHLSFLGLQQREGRQAGFWPLPRRRAGRAAHPRPGHPRKHYLPPRPGCRCSLPACEVTRPGCRADAGPRAGRRPPHAGRHRVPGPGLCPGRVALTAPESPRECRLLCCPAAGLLVLSF